MSIGQRIKSRREELGMSQEELAHRIGYKSKSSINKIELDIQQLRQSKIKQIADALETTTDYIMGWSKPSFHSFGFYLLQQVLLFVPGHHGWVSNRERIQKQSAVSSRLVPVHLIS